MIVYKATKSRFLDDHDNHDIKYIIAQKFLSRTGFYAPDAEMRAWKSPRARG